MLQAMLVKDWAHGNIINYYRTILIIIAVEVRDPANTLWQPDDLRQTSMTDFLFNVSNVVYFYTWF